MFYFKFFLLLYRITRQVRCFSDFKHPGGVMPGTQTEKTAENCFKQVLHVSMKQS